MSRVSLDTLIRRSLDNMGDVHPAVKDKTLYILHKAYDEGINVQISSGLRTFDQQARLYAQGRTAPGNVVTNAEPGESVHNYGLAIDYFLTTYDGQQAVWSVNDNWRRVAEIGKSLGFEWGGDWSSFVDYPHLQLTGGLNWRDLKAGRRPSGEILNEGVTRKGHSGWEVYQLQCKLKSLGYALNPDGLFGPRTDEVLKQFQSDHGLTVDGLFGPNTQAVLAEVLEDEDEEKLKEKREYMMAKNKKTTGYTDVRAGEWFTESIKRLSEREVDGVAILEGYPDGSFGVGDTVKREALAVVVDRVDRLHQQENEKLRDEIACLKAKLNK